MNQAVLTNIKESIVDRNIHPTFAVDGDSLLITQASITTELLLQKTLYQIIDAHFIEVFPSGLHTLLKKALRQAKRNGSTHLTDEEVVFNRGITKILTIQVMHIKEEQNPWYMVQIHDRTMEINAEKKEKDLVGAVQNLLIPADRNLSTDYYELSSYYQSADEAGGDWIWYEAFPDGSVLALVGDVTGHGIASAMVTAIIAGCFKTFSFNHEDSIEKVVADIKLLFEKMNSSLLDLCQKNYYFSACALFLHHSGEIHYCNAAAPRGYILRERDSKFKPIFQQPSRSIGSGPALIGLSKYNVLEGDRILLCSDGLFEMVLPNEQQLGIRKVKRLLTETQKMPVQEACDHMVNQLAEWRGKRGLEDDITFVLIDRKK